MSRKDYIAIGDVLGGSWASKPSLQVWAVTLSIADVFQRDNVNFDRSKFYNHVFGTPNHFEARDSIT